MRDERNSLRLVVVVAVLVAVVWSWGGLPVSAGPGEAAASPVARIEAKGGVGPLSTLLPQGIVRWLEAVGLPGFRSFAAPGGIGMDPNG